MNISVILDFSEVNIVLTAFINGLLSKIFSRCELTKIQNLIGFTESTHNSIIKKYTRSFDNARKFYSLPQEKQAEIKDRLNKIFNMEIALNNPLSISC